MTSTKELAAEESSDFQKSQVFKALCIITTLMAVVLTILSHLALETVGNYRGKLEAYLPIHAGEI